MDINGSSGVNKIVKIMNIFVTPLSIYYLQYTLHTFTESRATQWQTEPYKGL
jgi:hypothetical protein